MHSFDTPVYTAQHHEKSPSLELGLSTNSACDDYVRLRESARSAASMGLDSVATLSSVGSWLCSHFRLL